MSEVNEPEVNASAQEDDEPTPAQIVIAQLQDIADDLMTILSILSNETPPTT